MASVEELEATLDRELAFVRERARAEGRWGEEVLSRYRIEAVAPAKLPSVANVRVVVNALVLQCAVECEKILSAAPHDARATALWHRLTRVVDDEQRAHAAFLPPEKPKSKLLGNLFANATASVNEEFWTAFKWSDRFVAICKSCGAPQEKARDFKCRYCRGDLFRGPDEEGEA
jgi:hypothetical protein